MNPGRSALAAADHQPLRGWQAELDLEFEWRRGVTVLTRRRHRGPLAVQKSFHPEGDGACHVYIVHPPGGVAGGDGVTVNATLKAGAHAVLTTPAAGKFYRRGPGGWAQVTQTFHVDAAVLEWLPQENIFYPGAAARLRTIVKLKANGRFIGWDIACLGLPANDRTLEDGTLRMSFELWQGVRPVLVERLALSGEASSARWGLAGFSALGTAIFYPADAATLVLARASLPPNCAQMMFACTLVDGALLCRALGRRADYVRQAFVQLWRGLRPALLGIEAVPPRIWTT